MLDVVVKLAQDAGVLDRVVVVHADLGRMEWQGTRELAEEHAQHYGLRFIAVKRTDGKTLLEHIAERGMWPDAKNRYCTSDHKRAPIRRVMTALTGEKWEPNGRRVRILNCMGLRADESPARAKKEPLEYDETASNQTKREVWNWLPIHDWTVKQVWERIREAGTRHHPAYDKGMPRLSCVFCVFAPKSALMIAARENPCLFQEYIQVEVDINHRFRQDLALADVAAALRQGEVAAPVTEDWRM